MKNNPSGINLTLFEIEILSSDLQQAKTYSPIFLILFGRVTFFKDSQSSKASVSISTTPSGIVILSNAPQLLKALLPIFKTLS